MASEEESQQYHTAILTNNEYMDTEFDLAKESKFISYLDANNLYCWVMSKQVSTPGFKWMTDDDLDDWKHLSCILEVDLEYPEHGHNLHNDYPLASERVTIGNLYKLIPNLSNKIHYIMHYEHFKLCESLGLEITKIHRGIKLDMPGWKNTLI